MAKKNDEGLKILKADIKAEKIKPLYLIFGKEDFLKAYYFGELKKRVLSGDFDEFNYIVFDGSIDYDELNDAFETLPMMSDKKLILIKYSELFKNALEDEKKFWDKRLKDIPDYLHIVFYEKDVDKRSVLYKLAGKIGVTAECEYLTGVELVNWVGRGCRQAGMNIGQKEIDYLIRNCDEGMNNIKRELEKLFSYCTNTITIPDIDKIVTKMPQSRVFEMIGAIRRKDGETVFQHIDELKILKESGIATLGALRDNFEKILRAKLLTEKGMSSNMIASQIKVAPYFVNDYISSAKGFSKDFLYFAAGEVAETNFQILQGKCPEWLAVETFLIKCLQQ